MNKRFNVFRDPISKKFGVADQFGAIAYDADMLKRAASALAAYHNLHPKATFCEFICNCRNKRILADLSHSGD